MHEKQSCHNCKWYWTYLSGVEICHNAYASDTDAISNGTDCVWWETNKPEPDEMTEPEDIWN